MIRVALLLAALALSACVDAGSRPVADAGAPSFAPLAFFAGRTEGTGALRVIASTTRAVHVTGVGRIGSDGTLTLSQTIAQAGKPDRTRIWSLRATTPGAYAGTLSDAVGGVTATVAGNVLHIRFRTSGGVAIEQWLALQPGGRVARNYLVARKFGVTVAVLDETIRKIE